MVGVTMGGAEGEVGTMVDVEALAGEDISGRLVCVPCNRRYLSRLGFEHVSLDWTGKTSLDSLNCHPPRAMMIKNPDPTCTTSMTDN